VSVTQSVCSTGNFGKKSNNSDRICSHFYAVNCEFHCFIYMSEVLLISENYSYFLLMEDGCSSGHLSDLYKYSHAVTLDVTGHQEQRKVRK